MKPLKSVSKFDELFLHRKSLIVLPLLLIIARLPNGSQQVKLNETRPIIYSSSFFNTSDKPVVQYYANHRMNPDDTDNSLKKVQNISQSLQQVDRQALGSVLRPQIALQIYTDSHSDENKSGAKSQDATADRDTMLILPFSSHHQDHDTDGHPKKGSINKLNNWHYTTEQSEINDNDEKRSEINPAEASGNRRSPIIKAVITVPSSPSTEESQQGKSRDNIFLASQQQQDDLLSGSPSTSNGHNISHILADQSNDNLEITMSLNGEELVIDPVDKTSVVTASRAKELLGNSARRSRQSRDSDEAINRALRKHITSELAGDEQSASELDAVDINNEESEDYSRDEEEPRRLRPKHADNYAEGEDRAVSENRNWDDSSSADRDEQVDESKNQDGYSTRPRFDEGRRKAGTGRQAPRRGSESSRTGRSGQRKTASSKRRSTYRDEDKETRSDGEDNNEKQQNDTPSVIIKSEDVRRFEQLLENLRALSRDVEKAQSRLINKSSPPSRQANQRRKEQESDKNEDAQYRDEGDSSSSSRSSWNGQEFKSTNQPKVQSSSNSKSTHSEATSDCDRQKNQQDRIRKSASNEEPEVEPDSAPNIVDQDPMTSNDGGDDLNDEGSQNIEQEERANDNYSKVSLPNSKSASSEEASPDATEIANGEPRSYFVRKTILKNYDNAAKERADELERIHRLQHEEQHQRHMESMSDSRPPDLRLSQSGQGRQIQPNDGYIDYNKLDDREVYRSRDQRSDVPMTRNQVERMRSLQHLIERAAIDGSQGKPLLNKR